eukprot:g32702.t1
MSLTLVLPCCLAPAPFSNEGLAIQVFAGRISRGRADKAAAARRASEEAERLALQRIQDAERRALAWQTEERVLFDGTPPATSAAGLQRLQQLAAGALAQLSACQSEFKEAFSSLDSRLQEVETRGGAVARGLRALEPFVEQLSASSQVHRTAIAAEGKRIEEGLGALQEQVTKQQEDGFRIRREIQDFLVQADNTLDE